MAVPSRPGTGTRTGAITDRWLRPRMWDALALFAAAGVLIGLDLRGRLHAHVRLSHTQWISAPSTLAGLAALALVAAVAGRWREPIGLLGLAAAAFGSAAAWLLLGHHRWSGPVLMDFGDDHGLHLGDFAALVPAGVGLALVAMAWRLSRRAQ